MSRISKPQHLRTHKKAVSATQVGMTLEQIRKAKNIRSHQRNLVRKEERRKRAESLLA